MRNVYMYILLFMFCGVKSFGQGSDVIFWIDNSGSIDATEYANMKASIQSIMQEVLYCNPNNRVAVVQYGGVTGTTTTAKIYIESNFVNTYSTASTFINRSVSVGSSDYAHEAIGLIGKALDNILDANIVSSQKILTHDPSKNLVVFLFTDGYRSSGSSYIVNLISSGDNTDDAFLNYTSFKTSRQAKFVTVIVPPNAAAIEAAAAVASTGGSYPGAVESYPSDPDGSGALNRRLINTTAFSLSPTQIETVTDFICSVAEDDCADTLTLVSTTHDVDSSDPNDNRRASGLIDASNDIGAGAVGIYHSETMIVLTDGFYSANSSRFRAYIAPCDAPFVGRLGLVEKIGDEKVQSETFSTIGENDLSKTFTLYPNPANSRVSLSATDGIKAVLVTSLDGKVMYNRNYSDTPKGADLDISSYAQGYYMVSITTGNGEIQTQKLIKN